MTTAPEYNDQDDETRNPDRPRPGSRMHQAGRLSFRRRVPRVDDPDLPLTIGGESPPYLRDLVPPGFAHVEIEVGSGKGTFLMAATEARPDTFFLAIEAADSYARYSAERVKKHGRPNAHVLVDNALMFLADRVADGELDRLHVYFPDPWPKRRHRKRRFFGGDTPAVLHRALRPGGWLLVATDNAAYAGEISRVLGQSPLLRRDEAEERRLLQLGAGHGFSPTNFERKYIGQGRVIRRYAFQRVPGSG